MFSKPLASPGRTPYVLTVLVMLAWSHAALAEPWMPGQFVTYTQSDWGSGGSGNATLDSGFITVYPSAVVFVGSVTGSAMDFDNAASIGSYLPASGPPGALDSNYFDPMSTSSGYFGGDVLALQLDVDFSDAGITPALPGARFGDLVLENYVDIPQADGLTVRQLLADANIDLGGGASPLNIPELLGLVPSLTASFEGGTPSIFAEGDLVLPSSGNGSGGMSVAEPSSLLLLGVGLLALGTLRRRRRELGRSTGS